MSGTMKKWMKRAASMVFATVLAVGVCLPGGAADRQSLEELLPQIEQLQQLAQTYVQQTESTGQPLNLTINYIRAKRYDDPMWDMVLGKQDADFSTFVQQQAPELEQLQTQQNITVEATGETVDFVHLIVGIGATYQGVPVVCTWGGDCVQLAESINGQGLSEQQAIDKLKPYFATADENSSLFPQSDWIADQDGVNIGAGLTKQSDLSQQIADYYKTVTPKKRAEQFVQNQFGSVDTSQIQEFRDLVKQTFLKDSGVQLFLLSKQYITLNDQKDTVVVASMQQPLNAACSLVADTLAETLQGEQVTAQQTQPPTSQSTPSSNQAQSDGGQLQQLENDFVESVGKSPQIFLYVGGLALLGILLILIFMRR